MPDTPADDLTIHEPGDEGATQAAASPTPSDPPADDKDARIAQLETENIGLKNLVQALQDQLDAASEAGQAAAAAPPPAPRLIGEDWSNRTAAEAKAAGVTKPVLCADGYYVPGA